MWGLGLRTVLNGKGPSSMGCIIYWQILADTAVRLQEVT
jgi:hypothetical protein